MKDISIIIPVYNKIEWTEKCLMSIWKNSQGNDYEVIVVANGCTDKTVEKLRPLVSNSFCLRVYKKPLGYGKAINAGIKVALGKYLVLLNNDTEILGPSWLDLLIQPFGDPQIGITGPLMSWSPDVQSHFLIFCLVCIPRQVIQRIGLLDGKTFKEGYGEDVDYCMKIKKAGLKVVQVPPTPLKQERGTNIGTYPIYHAAEITVHDKALVPDWDGVKERNKRILRERYL